MFFRISEEKKHCITNQQRIILSLTVWLDFYSYKLYQKVWPQD